MWSQKPELARNTRARGIHDLSTNNTMQPLSCGEDLFFCKAVMTQTVKVKISVITCC